MKNTTRSTVPTVVSNERVASNRQEILRTIANNTPEVAKILQELRPKEIYRVVLSQPVRGQLHQRADGLFDAFVQGPKGRVAAVARLSKIGPNFLSATGFLAGQALMVQITQQLADIQRDVDLLVKMDIDDVSAKIQAAEKKLTDLDHFSDHLKESTLLQAHDQLNSAVSAAVEKLKTLLATIPDPPTNNVTRLLPIVDNRDKVVQALDRAEVMTRILLRGLLLLGEAHLMLNSPEQSARFMLGWLRKARELSGLKDAEFKARQLPVAKQEDRREVFWANVVSHLDAAILAAEREAERSEPLLLSWDCTAEELAVSFSHTEEKVEITDR